MDLGYGVQPDLLKGLLEVLLPCSGAGRVVMVCVVMVNSLWAAPGPVVIMRG